MGSRKVAPLNAAYTMNVTALVAANWRTRKMASGSIGAAAVRSRARKAASAAAPTPAMARTLGDDQPNAGPWMRANVRPARNATAVSAPGVSSFPVTAGSRDSGTCRAPSTTTAAAMGRLMKKIHRHDAAVIR